MAPEHLPLAHPIFASGLEKIFAFARGFGIRIAESGKRKAESGKESQW